MRAVERYADAAASGTDHEVIAAAGMVGCSEAWAMSLFRLKYSNDATEYAAALVGLKEATDRIYKRHNMARDIAMNTAKKVLDHWLFDACPHCLGRGMQVFENAPLLSDKACGHCDGGTVRWKGLELGYFLMDIVREAERRAGGKLMRKIKIDIDNL
jgi:hypothetical protein